PRARRRSAAGARGARAASRDREHDGRGEGGDPDVVPGAAWDDRGDDGRVGVAGRLGRSGDGGDGRGAGERRRAGPHGTRISSGALRTYGSPYCGSSSQFAATATRYNQRPRGAWSTNAVPRVTPTSAIDTLQSGAPACGVQVRPSVRARQTR